MTWLEEEYENRKAGELQLAKGYNLVYCAIEKLRLSIGEERAMVRTKPSRSLERIAEMVEEIYREMGPLAAISDIVITMADVDNENDEGDMRNIN